MCFSAQPWPTEGKKSHNDGSHLSKQNLAHWPHGDMGMVAWIMPKFLLVSAASEFSFIEGQKGTKPRGKEKKKAFLNSDFLMMMMIFAIKTKIADRIVLLDLQTERPAKYQFILMCFSLEGGDSWPVPTKTWELCARSKGVMAEDPHGRSLWSWLHRAGLRACGKRHSHLRPTQPAHWAALPDLPQVPELTCEI